MTSAAWRQLSVSVGTSEGMLVSTLFFVVVLIYTLMAGRRVAENYWGEGATTLEWSVSSPPPFHSYEELPQIR